MCSLQTLLEEILWLTLLNALLRGVLFWVRYFFFWIIGVGGRVDVLSVVLADVGCKRNRIFLYSSESFCDFRLPYRDNDWKWVIGPNSAMLAISGRQATGRSRRSDAGLWTIWFIAIVSEGGVIGVFRDINSPAKNCVKPANHLNQACIRIRQGTGAAAGLRQFHTKSHGLCI